MDCEDRDCNPNPYIKDSITTSLSLVAIVIVCAMDEVWKFRSSWDIKIMLTKAMLEFTMRPGIYFKQISKCFTAIQKSSVSETRTSGGNS
jgi:hypothetical protein